MKYFMTAALLIGCGDKSEDTAEVEETVEESD